MSTRCRIDVKRNGTTYRIYRHSDGYPEGVIADLYIFMKNYSRKPSEDPEYFLSNFMFYVKLSRWFNAVMQSKSNNPDTTALEFKTWEYGYGVCEPTCDHPDVEYAYLIEGDIITIIDLYNNNAALFMGTVEDAYRKFEVEKKFPNGCHLDQYIFNLRKILMVI